MRDQLVGREDTAPPSLLRAITKFEETLKSIYDFMKHEAEQKWGARLMRKSTIENALADYNAALDDAARAFQIATLINIHLAVGEAPSSSKDGSSQSSQSKAARREQLTSLTLPPYTAREGDVITDVDDLTMSPLARSATASTFDLLDGPISRRSSGDGPKEDASIDLIDLSTPLIADFETDRVIQRTTLETSVEIEEEEVGISEHHGVCLAPFHTVLHLLHVHHPLQFTRYHQSQFRMKGKSRTIKDGWWAGAVEGEVGGQKSLMLRYEGSDRKKAMKRWLRDVKMLQNVYHPNLPQMVGYSNDETPTPFILLANVQTRLPQALLLDAIKNANLAKCAQLMLQFYRDTLDAALYLQRQLDLSDSKTQDYVENSTYRIDAEQTVIMGLPPPEIDSVVSWRNYGLAHTVRDVYLKILPNRGLPPKEPIDITEDTPAEMQQKVNHLTILARALLPSADNITTVQDRLHKLLGSLDEDDEMFDRPPMTLRQIRKAAIAANTHQQAWFANDGVTPHKLSVGDLGYISKGSVAGEKNWDEFVVLCNVLDQGLARLETTTVTEGQQGSWQGGFHKWDELASYELPGGTHGWTVVVAPEAEYTMNIVHTHQVTRVHDAWNYLLEQGKDMAAAHGINPEDLILITRAGTDQRFRVRDLRRINYWPASIAGPSTGMHGFQPQPHFQHFQHGRPGGMGSFGHQPFGGHGDSRRLIPGQDLAPKVFYLFTSASKDHEPYFSQTPVPMPLPKGGKVPELDPNEVRCFALVDMTYGFLNYVQLHPEDFAN
ncbi:hypothetical protein C8Q76DRAFT_10245 [Earliella scabrosa]|nr:hypothetical protein C8Q76DRAFT_10245 [Earliella scabrosa]